MSDTVTGAVHTAGDRKSFPRLTDAMIRAACEAHYGSTNVDGVDLTANDHNWSFRDGFKRMWHGARKAYLSSSSPRAVSAAEGDLLGKMIEVIERAQQIVPDYYLSLHADFTAILSKAQAREVTR